MSAKRRRQKDSSFTPALVFLNLLIIGVIALMIFFIYRFITSEDNAASERTTPAPRTSRVVTEIEISEEAEEITTTQIPISMTKAITTTPASVTSSGNENNERIEIKFTEYDPDFFKDDLFIGDSIMTGISGFGFIPAENVYAKVGLNPESLLNTEIDGKTALQKIKDFKPRNIYIMLGTNGLDFMSGEYMAQGLGIFIDDIISFGINSNIIVMTIPPVTEAHDAEGKETMTDINVYNSYLIDMAAEKGCKLVDICSILKNSTGYFSDKYAEQDGLHFLGTAYKAVLGYLQEELQ